MLNLRRGFCPLCFRGESCTTVRVPRDSACIDQEQLLFSKVPVLHLSEEGPRCEDRRCRQCCLVCGNTTAFPCEPEYDEILDAIDAYEETVAELQAEVVDGMHGLLASIGEGLLREADRKLARRLRRMDMAWHPRWRKVVHAHCIQTAPCGCVLTTGADGCKTHPAVKRPRLPRRPPQMPLFVKPPMPVIPQLEASKTSKRPVLVTQSTWMKPPTSGVSIALPQAGGKPAPQKSTQKPKPLPPKTNSKLVQAAKGCGRIDAWHKGMPAEFRPLDPARGRPPFDMERHQREFDPFLHGYFRKNGVDMFRFPDGWVEPVFSSVNRITEDGHLVPG
jgi:hypothetical protein